MRNEGGGVSAPGPRPENRTAGQPTAGRRGEALVQMTASEIFAAAVNAVQNGWPADGLPLHVLVFVYQQIVKSNRLAVDRSDEVNLTSTPAREPD